ncbi:Lrp/AsnC family transcriptional regulator [Prauserella endophytica]|uniref:Lrp/AsnC family transcriptional regulator n=1 Tax=Prauserella endophytica TaxID=1592324 RepID=A0ABY2SBU4_9PSEU|nr:Lrp/AsnC family transcriptional regulator [Prauserella endophytica]TKG72824.1 Lrp/AsnC family transcriptional regulator [Prauserella endophytica]
MSNTSAPEGLPAGRTAAALDAVDRAMLDVLADDARISVRSLAERLAISRANAYSRLDRLLRDGVITGFGARIDPQLAGLGTSAYVLVTVEQTAWRALKDALGAIPYVEHIALVGGDVDVLLLVRTPDNATLRDVVLGRIQAVDGVRATRTWLVFDEFPGAGSPLS